jgi:hypothetical protein
MKQITILTDSETDMIAEVTEALAQAGVSIRSIAGEHYGKQGVINVTVDDEQAAIDRLENRHDWQIIREDALLIRLEDEVGALAKISRRFVDAGITLRSIRFVERHQGYALVAIATGDPSKARLLLKNLLAG